MHVYLLAFTETSSEDSCNLIPTTILVLIIVLGIIILILVGIIVCASLVCYHRGLHSKIR